MSLLVKTARLTEAATVVKVNISANPRISCVYSRVLFGTSPTTTNRQRSLSTCATAAAARARSVFKCKLVEGASGHVNCTNFAKGSCLCFCFVVSCSM